MPALITIVACLIIVATLLPLKWSHAWWIRSFDFPRLQIAAVALATLFAMAYFGPTGTWGTALALALCTSLAIQIWRIWAYTPLHRLQTQWHRSEDSGRLRILVTNVLQSNRDASALLKEIEHSSPDVVLALETDQWWQQSLKGLTHELPHTVHIPQDNTYGMLLYSRFQLVETKVRYLIEETVPSISTRLGLEGGLQVALYCLHPRPPRPGQPTTDRDAELVTVGKEVRPDKEAVIVAGDLNDVAWSHTTTLFQKISGLLDPRVGRGFISTFHARIPLLRFPLDHVFHSDHFRLAEMRRLNYIGSDHFPALFELAYEPAAQSEQHPPKGSTETQEEADEIQFQASDSATTREGA